jgi:hypothetical protein
MLPVPSGAEREITCNEVTPTHARACCSGLLIDVGRRRANHAKVATIKYASQSDHNTGANATQLSFYLGG